MKTVRFESNERVDLPDMMALANLPLGEFRRQTRATLVGSDTAMVLNGFKVEPTSVPSSAVEVVVSNGSDWPSHAIISDATSTGQLAGGIDDQGLPEASATLSLDLFGQPPGTYAIEMRYVMVPGDQQNRAFINPTTKVENTQQVDTRLVPQLELGFALAPTGGEWVHLADVAWGGVTVTAGNITDQRVFAFEVGPEGLFQATVWGGAGGMPDPQRSSTRAQFGNNAIIPAIRALQRQVQDIKGFNDSGLLDHFSRVRTLPRAGTGTVSNQQTRSIASMDMEELTVGDGLTTWGDFNGPTGLQLALDHVALNRTFLHKHVMIKVKTRSNSTSSNRFTLTTPVDISGVQVTIDCITGNNTYGRMKVDFAHVAGAFFTSTTVGYPLEIRNMEAAAPSGIKTVYPLYNGANATAIVLRNCLYQVSASVAQPVIIARAESTRIEDCFIYGEIRLGGGTSSRPAIIRGLLGNSSSLTSGARTSVRLYQTIGSAAETSENVVIEHSLLYQVDGRGASNVVVRNCHINHVHSDGVILGRALTLSSKNWLIQNNTYQAAPQNSAGHVTTNGSTIGTGWHVNCIDDGAPSGPKCTNIVVSGVESTVLSGTDSGLVRLGNVSGGIVENVFPGLVAHGSTALIHHGIRLDTSDNVTIRNCDWTGTDASPDVVTFRCVLLTGSCTNNSIEHCVFVAPGAGSTDAFHVKAIGAGASLQGLRISKCTFRFLGNAGSAFEGNAHVSIGATGAVFTTASGIEISDCLFDDVNQKYCLFVFNGISALRNVRIDRNRKIGEGDFVQFDSVVSSAFIRWNEFEPGTSTNNRFATFSRIGNTRVTIEGNTLVATNALSGLVSFTGANSNLRLLNNNLSGLTNNIFVATANTDEITVIGNYSMTAAAQIVSTTPPPNHIGWGNVVLNRFVFV